MAVCHPPPLQGAMGKGRALWQVLFQILLAAHLSIPKLMRNDVLSVQGLHAQLCSVPGRFCAASSISWWSSAWDCCTPAASMERAFRGWASGAYPAPGTLTFCRKYLMHPPRVNPRETGIQKWKAPWVGVVSSLLVCPNWSMSHLLCSPSTKCTSSLKISTASN